MQFSVEARPPVPYPFPWNIAGYVLIALAIILPVLFFLLSGRKQPAPEEPVEEEKPAWTPPRTLNIVKGEYLRKLDDLESKVNSGSISMREGYQRLSNMTRAFVYEVTGIHVQDYTITEIRRLDMPILTDLMNEYYRFEFSEHTPSSISDSIERTKGMIARW
jgi:hypothetical protein